MLHCGVYHPLKSEKINYVVFDCSSEYRGRLINKELLAGPNLTNQIVGTFIKSRQDKMAFGAGIKKCPFKCMGVMIVKVYYAFCGGKMVIFADILIIVK